MLTAAARSSLAGVARASACGSVRCIGTTPLTRSEASAGEKLIYRPMDETVRTFLNPAHFMALLKSKGTTFFTGVPDSLLKDFTAYVTNTLSEKDHVITANEGTAMAVAAGHHLGTGKIPVVYLQNSGLGNTVNPLLSLCSDKVYSIPVLLIVGWRGEPGKKDEPQHQLQGRLTPSLLNEMGVPYEILPDYAEGAFDVLEKAYKVMHEEKKPFALLIKKQTFEATKVNSALVSTFSGSDMLHREEILERIIDVFPEDPCVTTTGFTSREMFELRQAKQQGHGNDFLTVGSMGHCSSITLGLALSQPTKQVLCVDGDGAALMHMGAMATAGLSGAKNFKHILINNAIHDSVGGQPTGGDKVDFVAMARSCGYTYASSVSGDEEIQKALEDLKARDGPVLLEIKALPGARQDLGRPTTTTIENKEAFMATLQE